MCLRLGVLLLLEGVLPSGKREKECKKGKVFPSPGRGKGQGSPSTCSIAKRKKKGKNKKIAPDPKSGPPRLRARRRRKKRGGFSKHGRGTLREKGPKALSSKGKASFFLRREKEDVTKKGDSLCIKEKESRYSEPRGRKKKG